MDGAALTDEIQALSGRVGDTALITDARCTRWENEAQRIIAEKVPGLHELTFKNTDSFDTTVTLRYSLAEITSGLSDLTTENRIAHVFATTYLNGNETRHLKYRPVDEFDEMYPDPTHTDIPHTISTNWTRRGNYIEIMPLCLTENCDKDLRFDIGVYPIDITAAITPSLNDADDGLIAYGVWHAFVAIGAEKATDAAIWKTKFFEWLEDYKDQNDTMHEWDGNWYE
ncbi:hypothetical protein LCGC14_0638270 [marine sediment metagenome]|uniref:Uncharacterized protein n=1 Tax=marine sediment metagenome TaxID=412755 RepID=A0A0F9TLG7_9ZZZZ